MTCTFEKKVAGFYAFRELESEGVFIANAFGASPNNCTLFIIIVLFKELFLFDENNCQYILTIKNKVLPLYHQTATKRFRK